MDKRITIIDELRGLAVVIMIVFHFIYQENLWGIAGNDLLNNLYINLFKFTAQVIFIFIAGICCNFSHDNAKRGLICIYIGLLINFISFIIVPQNMITFGIFSFMGCAILFYVILEEKLAFLPVKVGLVLFSILFILSYLLSYKIICPPCFKSSYIFKSLKISGCLNFMGFTSVNFKSSDFFPIVPWIFIFISGTFEGRKIKRCKHKKQNHRIRILEVLGKKSLLIYIIHIPLILFIIKLFKL